MGVHFHHHGTVSVTDLKDSWDRDYGVSYATYIVENTDDHGTYEFVVESIVWKYTHGPTAHWKDSWDTVEKIRVGPGEKKTGTFAISPKSDPSTVLSSPPDSRTQFKIHAKWIVSTHKAYYDIKIEF